jgi:hypothetical protein
VPNMNPSPFSRLATTLVSGLVSPLAQVLAGTKQFNDPVRLSAGSLSSTAIGPAGDDNTGVNFPAADTINLVTGGVLRAQISSTGTLYVVGQTVSDGGIASTAGSSVLTLNESFMKGSRGTAKWSLNEAGGGTAQLYNTSAGVEVLTTTAKLYGRGTGATDLGVVAGFSTAYASTHASAKPFSVRAGIGGSETELAYFDKNGGFHNGQAAGFGQLFGASAGSAYLQIDDTNGVKMYLAGLTAALTGSGFAVASAFNLSSPGSPSFQLNSGSNSQIVSAGKVLYVYATGSSALTETIRLVGNRADSGLRVVTVGTESASPNAASVLFQVAHSITTAGNLAGNGTALFKVFGNGNAQVMGGATLGFETYGDNTSITVPGGGGPGEITINAAKGRTMVNGAYGQTVVTCNKCTAESVVVVTFEDPGQPPHYVSVTNGSFTVGFDGGGWSDANFRFIVFN